MDGTSVRLDREGIYRVLKNRKPLLFVDGVLVEPGKGSRMERTVPTVMEKLEEQRIAEL